MDDADLRINMTPTLRAQVVDRLRQAIIGGRFQGGDRLVERTLCDQLGVSRSVVREAIRYLEAEGLVDTTPRAGPIVARLDWGQAQQVYAIRRLLEADAAAACAKVATPAVNADLAAALQGIETALADPARTGLYDATTAFYRIIFAAAGHDIAWEIVQRLNGRISRLRALTLATADRKTSGPAHMARIGAAIAAADPDAAADAVRAHLDDAATLARTLLGDQ
jgi:DNA-binding GntR family transcriptional regulator